MLHPGGTVEMTMVAELWVCKPQGHECDRPDPATHLPWGGTGTHMMLFYAHGPFPAAEKALHRLTSSGELVLSHAIHRSWGSEPCTSPGQHSKADPVGRGASKPAPRVFVSFDMVMASLLSLLPSMAIRRTNPSILRVGEPALIIASCSTQEIGCCTLPGQHNSRMVELVLWTERVRAGPTTFLT